MVRVESGMSLWRAFRRSIGWANSWFLWLSAFVGLLGFLLPLFGLRPEQIPHAPTIGLTAIGTAVLGLSFSFGRSVGLSRKDLPKDSFNEPLNTAPRAMLPDDLKELISDSKSICLMGINCKSALTILRTEITQAIANGSKLRIVIAQPDSEYLRQWVEITPTSRTSLEEEQKEISETILRLRRIAEHAKEKAPGGKVQPIVIRQFSTECHGFTLVLDDYAWFAPYLRPTRLRESPALWTKDKSSEFHGITMKYFEAVWTNASNELLI